MQSYPEIQVSIIRMSRNASDNLICTGMDSCKELSLFRQGETIKTNWKTFLLHLNLLPNGGYFCSSQRLVLPFSGRVACPMMEGNNNQFNAKVIFLEVVLISALSAPPPPTRPHPTFSSSLIRFYHHLIYS